MVIRIAALVLMLATAAMPAHALEDEMGRLVDPNSTFSRDVVSQVQGAQADEGSSLGLLLNIGAGLAVVLAVGGLALWWSGSNPRLRRMLAGSGIMRVISRLRLGVRHEIVLVKVGDRALLIGTGPAGMNTLAEFTDPAEIAKLTENPSAMATPHAEAKPVEPAKASEPTAESKPRLTPVRDELAKLAEKAAA